MSESSMKYGYFSVGRPFNGRLNWWLSVSTYRKRSSVAVEVNVGEVIGGSRAMMNFSAASFGRL